MWRIPEADICAAGFGDRLIARLAAHEADHGVFARLAPGEDFPDPGAVPRLHNRSPRPNPDQLALSV